MKIFLDVGCNEGQSIESILDPRLPTSNRIACRYEFDLIYGFEPVPELHRLLEAKFHDPRIKINNFGLWKENCEKPIYSPGSQSGSIYVDKYNVDPQHSMICKFVRASDWFRVHLSDQDEVYLKMNCEGCEVDIIEDLLDTNEYRKVTSFGVTFDVRKIPSQVHREIQLKQRLADCGHKNFVDLEFHKGKTRRERMHIWLSSAGADRPSLGYRLKQAAYFCQTFPARAPRGAYRRLRKAANLLATAAKVGRKWFQLKCTPEI